MRPRTHSAALLLSALFASALPAAHATRLAPDAPLQLDRSGRKQVGKASYYAHWFAGRTMANGEPMRIDGDNAASRTLPLGTKARVTNLENGRSALVVIKDRGPYVAGRIVDVSPGTAAKLGMLEDGVVPVEVQPIALPAEAGRNARNAARPGADTIGP